MRHGVKAQVKTSNANVLRSSFAQSTRGIRSFFGSLLSAASSATLAPSSPAAIRFQKATTAMVDAATDPPGAGREQEVTEKAKDLRRLRKALVLCLPPFARAPENDSQFSDPEFDAIYSRLTAREMQGKWK